MRCRACNEELSEFELRLKREDGKPEDICVRCKVYIRECIDDSDIHYGHIPYYSLDDTFIDWDDNAWDGDDE